MFVRGAFPAALQVGLEQIRRGQSVGNEEVRGWKLFLLSRMLLFRPTQRRPISTTQVGGTLGTIQQWGVGHIGRKFTYGNCEEEASQQKQCGTQNGKGFPFVGEFSSGRHLLESSPVALGNEATEKLLTDEARRPNQPNKI